MIGGKELDLHVLYVEVTRRGGYEKVNPSRTKKIFMIIHSYSQSHILFGENACELIGGYREKMEGSWRSV